MKPQFKIVKLIQIICIYVFFISCTKDDDPSTVPIKDKVSITASIDLVAINDDKAVIQVFPKNITTNEIVYYMPKIVPGIYEESNYGRLVEDFKPLDQKGEVLRYERINDNSWKIFNAGQLYKIEYLVNDSFDAPDSETYGNSSGTNIEKNENYLINFNGFLGYFEGAENSKYKIEILYPSGLDGITSLDKIEKQEEGDNNKDIFIVSDYRELVDNPILYSKPDHVSFMVDDLEVTLSVYSPNKLHSSTELRPSIEKLIRAQKEFLGDIKTSNKYKILLYLFPEDKPLKGNDAGLEHRNSTLLTVKENFSSDELIKQLDHFISHEFFHILIPISIHSEEIHDFDFNNPKMSKHLWFYEGLVEYFSGLFRVQQGIITQKEFLEDIVFKQYIQYSKFYENIPLTVRSKEILNNSMFVKESYVFYTRGALVSMFMDIITRSKSKGKNNVLELVKRMSDTYGPNKPFKDDELFSIITDLTTPEMKDFFELYVSGSELLEDKEIIDYFYAVGVGFKELEKNGLTYFHDSNGDTYYKVNEAKQIVLKKSRKLNTGLLKLGLKGGDIIDVINGVKVNLENQTILFSSWKWVEEKKDLVFEIIRDGEKMTLKGKAIQPKGIVKTLVFLDLDKEDERMKLRENWLGGSVNQ